MKEKTITIDEIKSLIYDIRGKKVILDSDLARLFQYKNGAKAINLSVKRNIERFSNGTYFQIKEDELNSCSRFQSETLNTNKNGRGSNVKYLPYAFTEEGVIELSKILKSPIVIEVSFLILSSFNSFKQLSKPYKIEDLIYEVRGKQVMLDFDLAELYNCKNGTKSINLAVSRHVNRFPERFMFQLKEEEFFSLRFQVETAKLSKIRTLPYAFTEQGVAMLATILRTPVAEAVSINIMDAFVAMKKYISSSLLEQKYINNQVMKNTEDIKLLQESFSKFEEKQVINEIYFNGQIYDAYSKIVDIMSYAKQELIIIDGYADKIVLDMISKITVPTTLIVKTKSLLSKVDIQKYNSQYNNLTIIHNDTYHDRYIILDKKKVYHCGASINHAGSKTFSINVLEDAFVIDNLISKVSETIKT